MHQLWYENPKTLKHKYDFATSNNLRGVGMWNADSVTFGGSPQVRKAAEQMWEALPDYKHSDGKR